MKFDAYLELFKKQNMYVFDNCSLTLLVTVPHFPEKGTSLDALSKLRFQLNLYEPI